jgi:alpha-L-fucosidase
VAGPEVLPSPQQLAYQQMELIGFIHFSINTFTDKEWGYGDESPMLFNPASLDARQWARVAKDAGMKQLILTAKHHDGFCLWPSAYTEHSVKNSPWRGGEGDLVKEFTDACREYGLKCGLYLSPWDRNHRDYGKPEYIDYYRKQLTELLTNYGEISEIWFDGANGGDGFYGGANEIRHIDREEYYDWDSTFRLVYSLQPDIIIFSDAGPGCRWIGNERGIAGETCWSTITADSLIIGASKQAYLNTGDPDGTDWIPGECDVSIRPGWFYHASQDSLVKSLDELIDIYYGSVGRNGVLLLNIPPDQRGLIHENDVGRLEELAAFIRNTFENNPVSGIEMSEVVELPENTMFDLIVLGEDISKGQRVHGFTIEAWQEGSWQYLTGGTTIGYKRILQTSLTTTPRLRFTFESDKGKPMITTFGLYRDARNLDL